LVVFAVCCLPTLARVEAVSGWQSWQLDESSTACLHSHRMV
jgi:hypothetical protein